MATARRPYHYTADSVIDEDWNNDVAATFQRLQAYLHSRWRTERLSAERAGHAILGTADLLKLTHSERPYRARRIMAELAVAMGAEPVDEGGKSSAPTWYRSGTGSLSVRYRGGATEVTWPKWPEFQRLGARNWGQSEPLQEQKQKQKKRGGDGGNGKAPPANHQATLGSQLGPPQPIELELPAHPEDMPGTRAGLDPAFWSRLAAENPLGIQTLEPQVAMAWYVQRWPRMRDHGYSDVKRAVRSWWGRVTREELASAREYLQTAADQAKLREARSTVADREPVPDLTDDHWLDVVIIDDGTDTKEPTT